jgi:endogenous inhibitor of DNA gyrase (YacG/DUF329 family)
MAIEHCPKCGHNVSAEAAVCPACGGPVNGLAAPGSVELPFAKLSPELLEWARRDFNEEEFLAGLREIEETGGLELKDFIQELEQEAEPGD